MDDDVDTQFKYYACNLVVVIGCNCSSIQNPLVVPTKLTQMVMMSFGQSLRFFKCEMNELCFLMKETWVVTADMPLH